MMYYCSHCEGLTKLIPGKYSYRVCQKCKNMNGVYLILDSDEISNLIEEKLELHIHDDHD